MANKYFFLALLTITISLSTELVSGQACDSITPSYIVDLSSNPDSIWISPVVKRDGLCCSAQSPDRCIEFIISLHPSVGGIYLDIYSGAKPSGSMFYMLNCDSTTLTAVGDSMCINGPGPHRITFCKPGNNNNEYIITGIGLGNISPPIIVSEACSDTLYATGFVDSTIVWTSIPSDSTLESFLNCSTGCDTVIVTPSGTFPDSIMYKVCGQISGLGCNTVNSKCDSTWVYFINTLDVQIVPQNPAICFGGTDITLSANVTGGSPPYSYLWSNGATSDTIIISSGNAGAYWVDVTDETGCPSAQDTVIVIEFSSAITANAGSDSSYCANYTSIPLTGIVTGVNTGSWSGGAGSFSPSSDSLNTTYTPTPAEIASGSVSLFLITTNTGTCPPDTDSIVISFDPIPIIEAGPNAIICIDSAGHLLSSASSSTSNISWSTTGSGIFIPNTNTINPTYVPAVGGIDTLILSTLDACNLSDTVIINITLGPIADTGPDTSVCSTNPIVNLNGTVTVVAGGTWTTSGTGTFTPSDTSLSTAYVPSPADTIQGSVMIILIPDSIGTCIVPDTLFITYTSNEISVDAGEDTMVCKNVASIPLSGSVIIAGGGTWSTSGTGTFTPSADSLITNYIPSAADTTAGSITLTLTSTGNGGCGGAIDQMTIGFLPGISVNAGNDTVLCVNEDTLNLAGFISGSGSGYWSTSGNGSFFPSDSALNTNYIFTTTDLLSGSVTLILTANVTGFCAAVDSLQITIIPNSNVGPDQYICEGEDTIQLNGSVGGATGGIWGCVPPCTGSFFPNDTSLATNYILSPSDSAAGSVTITLTSTGNMMGCATVSDTLTVFITPPPTIDVGPDTLFVCSSYPVVDVSGIITNATGGTWSTSGTGTFVPSPDSLTTTYIASNADTTSGNITLTLTSLGSCLTISDSVVLSIIPGPKADFVFTEVCIGDSITFNDASTGAIIDNYWDFGDGDTSVNNNTVSHLFTNAGPFEILYVVTSTNGCIDSISKTLLVHPLPVAAFSSTAECMVDSAYFTDLSTISFDNISSWEWSFGDSTGSTSQNPSHLFINETTYVVTLVVTSSFGCSDTIMQTLNVAAGPKADFTYSQACFPAPISFVDVSTIDTSMFPHQIISWAWDYGDGNTDTTQNPPPHSYNNPGTYNVSLIVESENGCKDTVIKVVNIGQSPIADFLFSHVCEIDTASFIDSSTYFGSDSIVSWTWNLGDGTTDSVQNPQHLYTNYGVYLVELIIETVNGCTDTAQHLIVISPNPDAEFTASDHIVSTEDIINFTDESSGSSFIPDTVDITGWAWDFYYPAAGSLDSISAQPNPSVQYHDTGFFVVQLIVTNEFGCMDTTDQLIQVGLSPLVPSGFSPDGNGENDILYVEGGPYLKLEFAIYNEWGETIFLSNSQDHGWNGTYKGVPQPIGVYVYTVFVTTIDEVEHKLWGNVTLLR